MINVRHEDLENLRREMYWLISRVYGDDPPYNYVALKAAIKQLFYQIQTIDDEGLTLPIGEDLTICGILYRVGL